MNDTSNSIWLSGDNNSSGQHTDHSPYNKSRFDLYLSRVKRYMDKKFVKIRRDFMKIAPEVLDIISKDVDPVITSLIDYMSKHSHI